jgi:hypothetical protein
MGYVVSMMSKTDMLVEFIDAGRGICMHGCKLGLRTRAHSRPPAFSTNVECVPGLICHVTMKESIDVLLWG